MDGKLFSLILLDINKCQHNRIIGTVKIHTGSATRNAPFPSKLFLDKKWDSHRLSTDHRLPSKTYPQRIKPTSEALLTCISRGRELSRFDRFSRLSRFSRFNNLNWFSRGDTSNL